MLNVLLPTRKWETPRVWHAMAWCLSLALCSLVTARAQDEPDSKKDSAPAGESRHGQSRCARRLKPKPDAGKTADAADAAAGANRRRPEPDPQDRPERGLSGREGREALGHGKTEDGAGQARRPERDPRVQGPGRRRRTPISTKT